MSLLTIVNLIGFSAISILMIKSYESNRKLTFIEKLLAFNLLFVIYSIVGILLHFIYFNFILGQNPTSNQFVNKIFEIIQYDSHLIIITTIILSFVNSKVVNEK